MQSATTMSAVSMMADARVVIFSAKCSSAPRLSSRLETGVMGFLGKGVHDRYTVWYGVYRWLYRSVRDLA
jgi:hypothetical protein